MRVFGRIFRCLKSEFCNEQRSDDERRGIPASREELFKRYKLVIAARNFHYENFSKWMTFFYVAIGALFVGYCKIIEISNSSVANVNIEYLRLLLLVLGYTVSLLWYWSSKGYYYWAINFISLVSYYERKLLKFTKEESVYSVFANEKENNSYFKPTSGANISTSKIAVFFAFIVSVVWGIILLGEICVYNDFEVGECKLTKFFFVSVIISVHLGIIAKRNFGSKPDYMLDLKISSKDNRADETP